MLAVLLSAALIRPGDTLRADATTMGADRAVFYQYALPIDASVASWRVETDRNRERSTVALRMRGGNASGRLRGDFSIARGVVASAAEALDGPRQTPSSIDVAYDLLRNQQVGEQSRVTLIVGGNRKEKMVKDIEGSAAVNLVLAIFPWLDSSSRPSPWSAKVGVGLARIRQLMAQGTGLSGTRQVSTTLQTVGAQWSQQWLTLDYRFAFTGVERDGEPRPDPSTLQSLLASFEPDPRFTLRAGLAGGQLGPRDPRSRHASLGVDLRLDPNVIVSSGCDIEVGSGTEKGSKRGCGVSGGFARSLDCLGPLRLPVDVWATPSFATSRYRSSSTDLASNDWRVDVGFSLKF